MKYTVAPSRRDDDAPGAGERGPASLALGGPGAPAPTEAIRDSPRAKRQNGAPSHEPTGSPLGSVALLIVLFSFFALWGLLRPPFQSPDEFAHVLKAQATATHPWITPPKKIRLRAGLPNPLAWHLTLHRLPFHFEERLSAEDIEELRTLPWPHPEENRDQEASKGSAVFLYPALYYLGVFSLGQSGTAALGLAPYESFFAYRLASAFLATLAWFWVYLRLDAFGPYRKRIFAALVLIPGVAFLASSVNPDALLIPITTVSTLLLYRSISKGHGWIETGAALVVASFVKTTGILILPALSCVLAVVALTDRTTRRHLRERIVPLAITLVVPAVAFFLGFYAWSSLSVVMDPVSLTFGQYARSLIERLPAFVMGYWGAFGWADYHLPWATLVVLAFLLLVNLVALASAWADSPQKILVGYCMIFAIVFAAAIFAVEGLFLEKMGLFLQGRYFLPASLGIAVLVAHPNRPLAHALVGMLAFLNGYGLVLGVERYYDGRIDLLSRAIPFIG